MAFWGGCAAHFFNTVLHIPIALTEGVDLSIIWEYSLITFLLGFIMWSAVKNWHFQFSVSVCGGVIFFHLWLSSFLAAAAGEGSIFTLPVMVFLPIWLVMTHSFLVMLFYSIAQAIFVYLFTKFYAFRIYGVNPNLVHLEAFAIVLAVRTLGAMNTRKLKKPCRGNVTPINIMTVSEIGL